ncbi:hypothetical protein [Microcoleus sp. D2_18a_D3]|uniref:hypothetical protein n=1 Tax=Microcoleus sp. D2_18a_D3 TaxID=3055330 RepID=UPI002FCFB747
MVQLSEKADRTSRSIRAIVPNASLASFAVSEACRRGSPTPNPHPVKFCDISAFSQAHPLTLTGRRDRQD